MDKKIYEVIGKPIDLDAIASPVRHAARARPTEIEPLQLASARVFVYAASVVRRRPPGLLERRRVSRNLPAGSLKAQVRYLLGRVETLEQLCYAQVRRITALQAHIDHLDAKRRP